MAAEPTAETVAAPESHNAAAEPKSTFDLTGAVEAVLLSAGRPVPASKLAEALGLCPPQDDESDEPRKLDKAVHAKLLAAVETLNEAYRTTGRAFRIEAVSGGYRYMTLAAYAAPVAAFHRAKSAGKLSRASIETLAIIAYKQPITRAELEAIRGVACGEVLKTLIDRRLVTIKGRAEELGRPMLYGTTRQFLDAFGLPSLADLPTLAELKPPAAG